MSGIVVKSQNLYIREGFSYHNKNKLIKLLLIHALIFIAIECLISDSFKDIVIVMYLCVILMESMPLGMRYYEGYRAGKSKIQYYDKFRKRYIVYSDIKSVIVSHAVGRRRTLGYLGKYRKGDNGKIRFKPYPWITLCNPIPEDVIKKFNNISNYTLDGATVDSFLKKNGIIYSFIWNEWAVENLLAEYKGDFYITNSIAVRYRKELQEIMAKYKIHEKRIHIIEDVVATHFLWDNNYLN